MIEFIDIETTGTNNKALLEHLESKVEPDSRLKDPRKIMADIDNKKREVWAKTALTGFCEIACICAISDGQIAFDESVESFWCESEELTLKAYFKRLESLYKINNHRPPKFAGYNISSFDLRILWNRCISLGIKPPFPIPYDAHPLSDRVIDLYAKLNGNDRYASGTLLDWSIAIGSEIPTDDMPGKDVPQAIREGRIAEVVEHCKRDVLRARELYMRLKSVGYFYD